MRPYSHHLPVYFTLLLALSASAFAAEDGAGKPTVGIIGTGDMGDSLGPRFA